MHAHHPPPSAGDPLSGGADVPAAPIVKPDELWSATPNVLVDGGRYAIGWQDWPQKKGGPGFVVARRSALGTFKVAERYPLTDDGWAQAWRTLVKLDPVATEQVRSALARRAEEESGFAARRALDSRSLSYLPRVIFIGGYNSGPELAPGHTCELRFLKDRLSVFKQDSLQALTEFSYASIQEIEIAGPGLVKRWSPGKQAMLTAAFGVTGALVAYGSTRIKTFVRVQCVDSELFFLHTEMVPDDLRIHLSPGLGAVRETRAGAVGLGDDQNQPRPGSLVDELSRLAGLLESGLLTREEFDQLKARLIASQ
jgi:Short C-terminal domain